MKPLQRHGGAHRTSGGPDPSRRNRTDGSESARYSGPAKDPSHPGATLAWANPANIAFDGKGAIVVTNHASLTGLPDPSPLFAVFDVYVNDKAGKLFGEFEN